MTKATLPVMEQFLTLQGEGYFCGAAAYFIRLAGCDVGCHWCDVKESWTIDKDQYQTVDQLVASAVESGAPICVITGGEPAMHPLNELTHALRSNGIRTHIETSGSSPVSGEWDWVTLSPKKFKAPLAEWYALTSELKVVIFNHTDFKWAEEHAAHCPETVKCYLQAEWSRALEMYPLMVNYVLDHAQWRLGIQMHKYIGVE